MLEAGELLLGGSPLELLRLSARGAESVRAWEAGAPVSADPARGRLARRLVAGGMAHPLPAGGPGEDEVTVVVPVKDRPAQLRRLLGSLRGLDVVVVDDGSEDPEPVAAAAAEVGATCLRQERSGGPASARNAGLAAARTPFVVFVDSDCVVGDGWLSPLLPHFADPLVAAVAPRIASLEPGRGDWIARYEEVCSPHDLGERPGYVRPRSRLPFVPGATLAVRRAAVGGGFDPELRGGEDVDLIWRLHEAGWLVRYEPSATVRHEPRAELGAWLAQRVLYGSTAGPLARHHPRDVAPVMASPWTVGAWLLVAARRPVAGAAVTAVATGVLARRLAASTAEPSRLATLVAARGTLLAGVPLAANAVRAWGPLALAGAVVVPRLRAPLLVAMGAAAAARWRAASGPKRLGPVAFGVAHAADDLAYGLGVLLGCVEERTLAPLVPEIAFRLGGPGAALRVGRRPAPASDQAGSGPSSPKAPASSS